MEPKVKSNDPIFDIARENLIAALELWIRETHENRVGGSLWKLAKGIVLTSTEFLETKTPSGENGTGI